MHTQRLVEQLATESVLVHRIDDLRDDRNAGDASRHVSVALRILSRSRASACLNLNAFARSIRCGKVDVPRMRRHVRTLGHVAHVAQVTVIDDVPVHLLVDAIDFTGARLIHRIEQRGKRIAEAEATPTTVTDVEDPFELLEQRCFVRNRDPAKRSGDEWALRDFPRARPELGVFSDTQCALTNCWVEPDDRGQPADHEQPPVPTARSTGSARRDRSRR